MRLKKSYMFLLMASILLMLAVPLVFGGFDQFKLLNRISWKLALIVLVIIAVSWTFNAARLRLLLRAMDRPIDMGEGALITIAGEFAGNATPGAIGLPVTYTFLLRKLKLSFGSAMGMVSVIVLMDVIFYGTLMPLAAVILFFEKAPHTSRMAAIIAVLVIGASITLWALFKYYPAVCSFIGRWMDRVKWLAPYRLRLRRMFVDYIRALRLLRRISWRQRIGLYVVTIGYWMPRYLLLVVLILTVGQKAVPFTYLFLLQGLLNLGGQIIIMPGGGGGVDVAYSFFMRPYLSPQAIGLTLLLWRACTYYLYLLLGAPVFFYKTGKIARELLNRKSVPHGT